MSTLKLSISEAYDILGLPEGASMDDVKKAYRKLAKKWHPDSSKHTNSEVKFSKIALAYERIVEWDRNGRPNDNLALFLLLRKRVQEEEAKKEKKEAQKRELRRRIRKLRRQQDREQVRQYKYAFYILLASITAYFGITQGVNVYRDYQIMQHPGESYAVIVEQERYLVHYTFIVDGVKYKSSTRVRFSRNHNKSGNGMPIWLNDAFVVRYSTEDPEYNEILFSQPTSRTIERYIDHTQMRLISLFPSSFADIRSNDVQRSSSCVALRIFEEFGFDGMASLTYSGESFLENASNNSRTYDSLIEEEEFAQCFTDCSVPVPKEI